MTEVDRALRALLADELAGREPPDLRARIRDGQSHARLRRQPRRAALTTFLVGSLLGAALVATVVWLRADHAAATGSAIVTSHPTAGRVVTGELAWQRFADGSRRRFASGRRFAMALQRGDRLVAATGEALTLDMSQLGRLVCEPGTRLEVKHVEWKQMTGGFVVGSVTVAAAFGTAQFFGEGEITSSPDESIVMASTPLASSGPVPAVAAADELATARQRIAELEARLLAREEVAPTQPAVALQPVSFAAIETGAEFADLLREIDWQAVGGIVHDYVDAKLEMETLLAAGEEVPAELRARVERFDWELMEHLGGVLESGLVPGETGTNKIHHPALKANLMQSMLAAAGMQLDDEQRRRFTAIGQRFTAEDAARRAGYDDSTMRMQRFVDEIELQERFVEAQRGVLSAEQAAQLSFGDLSERTRVDPFGSSYQWSKNNRPVEVRDRAHLAERAAIGYGRDLGLDEGQRQQLQGILHSWTAQLPQQWFDERMGPLDRNQRLRIERVRAAARHQLQLMGELERGLGLSAEQLTRLRELQTIYIPFGAE